MNKICKTRQVLAVVAVTTALCADQAAMAAQAPGPQAVQFGQIATRLVCRLAQNLRRAMPAAIHESRQPHPFATASTPRTAVIETPALAHFPISPFQFRLPPPVR